ncbi:hypothetical protein PP7435_CHR4-0860 [Komagataella phaffii CBS 7435]|uniref:OPA3-like protein n=2 Tax=Komagataella phaffii TaxID=460519 RepID=C4R705_KOMPG|nr:Hypothetical protein PAS_chr4_0155 [Komagataella phaffii GS115]AOA64491.1 GQ67_04466T0 [Komagataella phaffii]CAH2451264.1 Hypothetical protein BQ9382_C4-4510 [Komagataella phaffii CBS 7435]AOA70307.1 GQ68_04438T0 [Komagataella phaffii GS115]CAY71380.1 Hypothetical protein PAS_chr4_0155 [Komagataella phaffii GS115]SCV12424.1 hypothetical protein PP7435_CHR4-0860 [Komagataella phaffii CBS 7435]
MSITLKLTSLFIRTVSKPMASAIKLQAKEHPKFKKTCILVAQSLHQWDSKLRMRIMGHDVTIRPLNDAKAVENGANFLSEFVLFSVAGSLILFESQRQRKKEAARRENVADDISTLQHEIEYLKRKMEEYNMKLDDYKPPQELKPSILKLEPNVDESHSLPTREDAISRLNPPVKQQDKEKRFPVKDDNIREESKSS